jgi:3-oxoacyl-[acyl-carrier protein] reductase
MESNQELAGKVVVVTGSGRGIGKQIAIGAGLRGAKVALVEVIEENLEATSKEISAMGINVKGYLTDLSKESDVVNNFAKIEKWQEEKAFEHTKNRRPDLLDNE